MRKVLTHYTEHNFKFDAERAYKAEKWDHVRGHKPQGLWLSDDSHYGWKQWCTDQDWGVERLANSSHFECITDDWCVLRTVAEIQRFTHKYQITDPRCQFLKYIEWQTVMTDFKGILITPYQWEVRCDLTWYYTWDCSSACVWDLTTISGMKKYSWPEHLSQVSQPCPNPLGT